MGFFDKARSVLAPVHSFSGAAGAESALEGAELQFASTTAGIAEQREARLAAEARLQPFADLGLGAAEQLTGNISEVNIGQSSQNVLNDPFFAALAGQQDRTELASAAAQGRGGAGDTRDTLQRNRLLLGTQFRQQDFQNRLNANQQRFGQLFNIANLGQSSAAGQANAGLSVANQISNLTTQGGNALAAGGIGAANAQAQGSQNIATLGSAALAAFSDERLKTDIKPKGLVDSGDKSYNWYSWTWNALANALGLYGSDEGVIAQEVELISPHCVSESRGFKQVNYGAL